jgi:hypothetical protein
MTITVNIKNNAAIPKLPSEMPVATPFLVSRISNSNEKLIAFRTSKKAYIFIDAVGWTTYMDADQWEWIDDNYCVVPSAKIDIKIDVSIA